MGDHFIELSRVQSVEDIEPVGSIWLSSFGVPIRQVSHQRFVPMVLLVKLLNVELSEKRDVDELHLVVLE